MSKFTCNSCGLEFESIAGQHSHMKSEWHRYNLKRRVAQLPPITENDFNSKVSALKAMEEAEANEKRPKSHKGRKGGKAEDDVQKTITKKEQRRKEKEALQEKKRALLEQARKAMANSQEKPINMDSKPVNETEDVDEVNEQATKLSAVELSESNDDEAKDLGNNEPTEEQLMEEKLKSYQKIPNNVCLFSGKVLADFEEALSYMFKNYGFFIPEQKYLVDKSGLVEYLAEKIALGNVCLCCNYQGRSLEAVRAHMISKRHCRVPYESENEKLEISEFYDFTSTYSDNSQMTTKTATVVSGEEDNDEEWEDVSDDGEGEDEEEEEAPQELSYDTGYELHLPSGAVVGHRSLMRYYRQNVLPERVLSEGQGTVVAAETRHMSRTFDKKELALKKRVWKRETKANDINDRRAAKFINNQPHFRDPLLQ